MFHLPVEKTENSYQLPTLLLPRSQAYTLPSFTICPKTWKTCLNNSSCQLPHSKNKVSAFFCTRWKYCMGTALQRDLSSPNLTPNFFPFKCYRPLESEFPITDSVLEHRVEGITALWLRWKCVPKIHPIQFNKMCPRTYWEQSTFVK